MIHGSFGELWSLTPQTVCWGTPETSPGVRPPLPVSLYLLVDRVQTDTRVGQWTT